MKDNKDYDGNCHLPCGIVMKWDDLAEEHKERGFVIYAESGWHNADVDTEAMVIRQAEGVGRSKGMTVSVTWCDIVVVVVTFLCVL